MNRPAPERWSLSRRTLITGVATSSIAFSLPALLRTSAEAQESPLAEEVVIDLELEPVSLDPALGEEVNVWSIIHSVFDSVVNLSPSGEVEPLLAESIGFPDPLTCAIVLRPDRTFHDGTPVNSASVQAILDHIRDPESGSQIGDNFSPIKSVNIVDEFTIHFELSAPAPYLPSIFAAWLVPVPPNFQALDTAPVGSGPYRFISWTPGESIVLEANPDYPADSPKGQAVAKRVIFRFVPDASTRVADLLSGAATIVRSVPPDQLDAIATGGATTVSQPVTGISFVRIATDFEPFADPRVRQALNLAIDVPTLIGSLMNGAGAPLATLFPEGGLGFDPELAPLGYDPVRAKELLTEAGYGDGLDVNFDFTGEGGTVVPEAIAAMLGEVGIKVSLVPTETAVFNATWKEGAPLRLLTWRPVNDPYTLLNLVFSDQGYLSRYSSETAQPLIDAAAIETDPATRASLYRELGQVLQMDPPAIFLNSLVSHYGVATDAPAWTPRNDDYTIPTLTLA